MNKNRIKKIGLTSSVCLLAFSAGLASAFFLVPGRIKNIVFDDPIAEPAQETHFSKFVTKMMNVIDAESSSKLEGVVGSIKNLKVEWPQNEINLNGSLALEMRSIDDFDFTVDLDMDYNSKHADLGIGYTGRTFYLAYNDFRIKSSYVNTQDVFEKINHLFFNSEVPEGEGLGITVNFDDIIGGLIDGFDINSLMGGSSDGGLGIEFGEEIEVETNKIEAPLTIAMGEGKDPIELGFYLNKETNDIAGISLKHVEIDDFKISGDIDLDIYEGHPVYGFDNSSYEGYNNYKDKNFIEVINYKSWFDDIFNLLNNKKVGLDLDFSVEQDDGTGPVEIGQIAGKIDVDVSKFELPIPKVIDRSTFETTPDVEKSIKRSLDSEENIVEAILDNISAGIDLSVNKEDEHYADLNVTYSEENAYLSFNNDVIKTIMDMETLNYVIDKVSVLIEGKPEETIRKAVRGETKETGLFDFITSSELVTAIKSGVYDGILDVIENISNSETGINLKLNLSSLGLGENAKVELDVACGDNGEMGVIGINCSDIVMKEGIFQLNITSREFEQENISKVLNDKDNYEKMDFAVGVLDQAEQLLDSKKTGFDIQGSLLGEDNLGMSFEGEGQFDFGEKYGFGSINIFNHTNAENPVEKSETHPVKVFVNNTTEDKELNDMKLVYGQNGKLKGKLNVRSLDEMVALIKKVMDQNDRRFQKFLDPLNKMIYESVIGQIISSKDYMRLAKSSFIKSIRQNLNGSCLDISLSKDVFAGFLTEDLTIRVNFKVNGETKNLESLQIIDLHLNDTLGNKIVNFTLKIKDFDDQKLAPLNVNDTYMNFSSIATLLSFAIDTTELNSYHLKAKINADLGKLTLADIELDFYIEVIGEDTRVYGIIPDVPYIIIASNDMNTDVASEFVFEPSKHYDISSDDSIGGYFHILRSEKHNGIFNRNFEQYYYRCTTSAFTDDIMNYLLVCMLDFNVDIVNAIGKIDLKSSSEPVYEEMFTSNGFNYIGDANSSEWDVEMNLDKLTGISVLNQIKAQIYGGKVINEANQEKFYLNKIHANLNVSVFKIEATINLVDINPDAYSWAEQFPGLDVRYEEICDIYKNLSETKKATFDSKNMNNPLVEYAVKKDSSLPTPYSL